MTLTPGKTLFATGLLHNSLGLLVGLGVLALGGDAPRNLVGEMLQGGVVGAVESDPQRQIFFWFFFFGLLLLSLGWFMDRVEVRGDRVPAGLGWQLFAVGLAGGLLIPVSGFWLAVPQGLWVVWRARKAEGAAVAQEA
jgi:hypothetical protein